MIKNNKKNNIGSTLIETIFYVCLFVVLSLAIINAMITLTKAFKETTIQAELMQGSNVMERISREIRQANGINTISATSLKLDTTDTSGTAKTVEFVFSSPNIGLTENNIFTGNLNTPDATVNSLSFTKITTTKGFAVKVSLTVTSNHDSLSRSHTYYDTVVLRNVY